jgi:hypothetical protein
MMAIGATTKVACYAIFNCDEVFIADHQFLFVHCYVVHNQIRVLILISLNRVLERSRSDNTTKIIMESLMIGDGLPREQIAQKFICFRIDDVYVF